MSRSADTRFLLHSVRRREPHEYGAPRPSTGKTSGPAAPLLATVPALVGLFVARPTPAAADSADSGDTETQYVDKARIDVHFARMAA
ncbi:hypothetical protein ACIP8Z_33710 [Streptomyces sp. NPDC088553]|uniref:hypothetical protein n=1 Tax=Streptomyces sp. NPDC088553 TaxID=3365864 RepID=UPI0037F1E477